MKGLLREWLYTYKWWFIGSVALSAALAVLAPLVINAAIGNPDMAAMVPSIPLSVFVFCILFPTESACSSNTKQFDNRFARFSVTTMSPEWYTTTIFAKYLISGVIAIVLAAIPFITMYFGCNSILHYSLWSAAKTTVLLAVVCVALNALGDALTIKMKNRDKAMLLMFAVGITAGVVGTAVLIFTSDTAEEINIVDIINALNGADLWIYLGCAIILAVDFLLISKLIRKGELQ